MKMNLWHDIPPGVKEKMNVIIEIAKGSNNKYEIDKKTGLITLDRVAFTAQSFPFDYGFIPRTLWHDNDPVDVVMLSTFPFNPGILVKSRPVAMMNMVDGGEGDDKIIAVPVDDPRWDDVRDIEDINQHILKEIEHFYTTYKKLQNKEVQVNGFKGREGAEACFTLGMQLYIEKFGNKNGTN